MTLKHTVTKGVTAALHQKEVEPLFKNRQKPLPKKLGH